MRFRRRHPRASRIVGEGGFALPTVMFMTFAAFAIASVGITASINTQHGTTRDFDTKGALAVAEAGSQQALIRYNAAAARGQCVAPQTKQANGWCTPATGTLGNGSTFTYWVAPITSPADRLEILSQGVSDGVARRVQVTATSAAGNQPFLDAGVVGKDGIGVDSNADITADMATNGNITLAGSASTFICGNAQVGIGHDILPAGTTQHRCGAETQGEFTLPPVNQGNVRTSNDNGKFFSQNPATGKKPGDVCFNGVSGTGAASSACGSRELYVGGNAGVTLTSGNYSFCKLTTVSNSSIAVASGSVVRIYFDSPEACGYSSGVSQLSMSSNSALTVNGTTGATDFAMLFVGSDSRATSISLASNTVANQLCNQNFVVYAPRTNVEMASNSSYCGAIAGKTIHLNQNAHVKASNLATQFQLPNAPAHYGVSRFVECAAVASNTPATC